MNERTAGQILAAVVGIALVVAPLYLTGLHQPFHYDDIHSIVDNPHVRSLGNIPAFFSDSSLFAEDPKNAMYRPLVLVSYAFNHALSEYRTWSYHGFNILLHILNSSLVFALIRVTGGRPVVAFLGGLVFGLHPLNSEAVNYISSRSETLCAFFFAFSFYSFLRWRLQAEWICYAGAILCFIGALLAKSVGIMLPAVILLYEVIYAENVRARLRAIWPLHVPFWALAALYFIFMKRFVETAVVQQPVRSLDVQLWTQGKALIQYAQLLFLPQGLNIEHQFRLGGDLSEPAVLAAFLLLATIGVFFLLSPLSKEVLFWSGWSLIILLPTLVVPLNVLINEHRLYLPMMAFAVYLGHIMGWLWRHYGFWGAAICLAWIASYGILTFQRVQIWETPERLWADSLEKAPLMPLPHVLAGDHHKAAGDNEAALRQYYQALQVYPAVLSGGMQVVTYNNIGSTYLALGRNREAIDAYKKALAIDSSYSKAKDSLDALLAVEKEEEKENPQAKKLRKLGLNLLILGKLEDAIQHFIKSLEIQRSPETYRALALAYERIENWQAALDIYETLHMISAADSDLRENADKALRSLRLKLKKTTE